ncbi:hypothetical protein BASA81_005885 [Batrachochytrium salamandrivorans]|nr:hypothetical protein BASA81_005885 [Batrachochytrium salamandrivorans]
MSKPLDSIDFVLVLCILALLIKVLCSKLYAPSYATNTALTPVSSPTSPYRTSSLLVGSSSSSSSSSLSKKILDNTPTPPALVRLEDRPVIISIPSKTIADFSPEIDFGPMRRDSDSKERMMFVQFAAQARRMSPKPTPSKPLSAH